MDNNNINVNPEIVPDAPDAVIPEINTIEPINEIAETVIEEAPAVSEVAETVIEEASVVSEAAETVIEEAPVVSEAAETVIEEAPVVSEAAETVIDKAPEACEAAPQMVEQITESADAAVQEAQSVPVPEAFPDGCAPVVYAAGNDAQPQNAPYYAAADNYTQRSENGEGFALTAFILGLSSLVLTWGTPFCFICIAVAIAAIIFSAVAKKKGAVNSFQKSGLTMAIIGLILSVITSVSCVACDACAASMANMVPEEVFSELDQGDFEALQQFVEQYGNPEDVEEFNQALEQLQNYDFGQ